MSDVSGRKGSDRLRVRWQDSVSECACERRIRIID